MEIRGVELVMESTRRLNHPDGSKDGHNSNTDVEHELRSLPMQCVAGQILGKPIAELVVGGTPLNVDRTRNEILVTGLTEANGVFANKVIPGGYGSPCCGGNWTGDHLNAR